ncbi:MAG: type II secretion system protein [Elusimicrobiota bacterium]
MIANRKSGGFTLIELMVVVAVLTILIAVASQRFSDILHKSQEAATKSSLSALRTALKVCALAENGVPPDELNALTPEYIREIPGGDLPRANISWDSGQYQIADWWTERHSPNAKQGWAYDKKERHIWIPDNTQDTKGIAYHLW